MNFSSYDQLMQSAVGHQRAGRLPEAEQACRQALSLAPRQADANYLLGLVLLQQRRPADAIGPISAAIALRPGAAEYHGNLGHALRSLGRLDEAAAALSRAVQIKPDYALAHSNLGTVRRAQGRTDDAIACFQTATRLQPGFLPAWLNLGNALRDAGRLDEALSAFGKGLSIDPNNPDAHCSVGAVLAQLNQPDKAPAHFRAALKSNPRHLPSLMHFGMFLRQQGDIQAGIDCFRGALRIDPNLADAHERLAKALWSICKYDESIEHYQLAMRIAPSPRLRFTLATLIPPIYPSLEEVTRWRRRLESEVDQLHAEGFRFDLSNQPPPSTVYLPYQGFDDREIAKKIAGLCFVSEPTQARPAAATASTTSIKRRIRVAFISALFKNQTIGLWSQGLIAKLDRNEFEVIVISTAPHADETGDFIREHADRYIVLPNSLPQARTIIAALELGVLIYTDIGMETFTQALAYSRLARVQCVTVGHPITTGIATMDYYISSKDADGADAQSHYTEQLVRLDHLPLYYYRPQPPRATAGRSEFDLPEEANLYGCLQAQYKLHPSFDEAIGGILRADRKGLILLSRSGSAQGESIILQRIARTYPDIVGRVRFMPSLDRDKFRALTVLCDVLLAPFPFGAGDTSLEGFALGLPTVTLPTDQLRGRLTYAMYKMMGIDDCIADSVARFVEIAVKLAKDRGLNQKLRATILSANNVLYENPAGVKYLERFLRSAAGS